MFGGVMDFQFGGNAVRLSRWERFIQRCEFVHVQIIHDQDDRVCLREMDIDQVTQAVGEIDHGTARCHLNMTPGLQRCEKEKEVTGAVAFILVAIFGHRTGSGSGSPAAGLVWFTARTGWDIVHRANSIEETV